MSDLVARTVGFIEVTYGDLHMWSWGKPRYDNLAECIIDAVFSIRARHINVERALERWRAVVGSERMTVETAADCAQVFAGVGSSAAVLALPENRIAGRKKSEISADVSVAFVQLGISDLDDLRERTVRDIDAVRRAWLGIKGLGRVSWCHFRLVAGTHTADPDRLVGRLLEKIGGKGKVGSLQAADTIVGVATQLDISPTVVEYALSLAASTTNIRHEKDNMCLADQHTTFLHFPVPVTDVQKHSREKVRSTMGNYAKVGTAH